MKIQLLIAISESDYAEHLSRVLTKKCTDIFELSVCSAPRLLEEMLSKRRFDVALLDIEMAGDTDLSAIRLPLLVWDGTSELEETLQSMTRVRKYQRVSAISSEVVQRYAAVCGPQESFAGGRAAVTAVWSPMGGVGKTTVALALAAHKAAAGKRTVYLDLEPFSATPAYFKEPGKSISGVLEKLGSDVALLFQGIRQEDSGSGICYFGSPQNYDDINILTEADIAALLEGCAANADELIVDLGSACGKQTQRALELADQVLLVADSSAVCRAKCDQFRSQHNIYESIADKLTVAANLGARNVAAQGEKALSLPRVDSDDPIAVYQTLADYMKGF